ncbi:MAG: lysostaphin resistance A-like protein [Promethearchaeota archaeon]
MEDDSPPNTIQVIREPFLIRNPWFSIILVMLFYFLFQLVPYLIYSYIVDPTFIETNPYVQRIIEFVSLGLMLLLLIPFLRIPKDNKTYSQYMKDIHLSTLTFKSMLVGLLTLIVLFILAYGSVFLSDIVMKWYLVNVKSQFIPLSPGVITDFSYLLDPDVVINVYYALTPGIMEELAFRGIILVLLMRKYSWKKAVIVDGVLFGLFHLLNLLSPTVSYIRGSMSLFYYIAVFRSVGFQVIYAASLGIFWAYFVVKTRSLLPAIISHYAIDAFGGLVLSPLVGHLYGDFGVTWFYFISITLLGIGVLPAILNVLITKGFYKNPPVNPWDIQAEVEFKNKF